MDNAITGAITSHAPRRPGRSDRVILGNTHTDLSHHNATRHATHHVRTHLSRSHARTRVSLADEQAQARYRSVYAWTLPRQMQQAYPGRPRAAEMAHRMWMDELRKKIPEEQHNNTSIRQGNQYQPYITL